MRTLLIFGGVFLADPAFAYDSAPPHSFAKPTANGKYVLVMLQSQEGPRDKELKGKYSRSGLYPVNDPAKPVWACDWTADWEMNVFASDDGIFAVRVPDLDAGSRRWLLQNERVKIPPKKAGWEDAPALIIYQKGQSFRTLAIKEVFDKSQFTDRDCFEGPIVTIDSFRDAEGRVSITTEANGRKLTTMVNFRTGEVAEKKGQGGSWLEVATQNEEGSPAGGAKWGRVILLGLAVVAVCTAAFAGLTVLLVRLQRKPKA